jgi:hypothetical protein
MEVRIKGIKLETMAARQLPFQIVKLIWLTRGFPVPHDAIVMLVSRGPLAGDRWLDS